MQKTFSVHKKLKYHTLPGRYVGINYLRVMAYGKGLNQDKSGTRAKD